MSGEPRRTRHSPSVYRRRRLVLLLAVIVIGVFVWLLIAQPWRGLATESSGSTPKPTQSTASGLPVPEASTASPAPTPENTTTDADGAASATPTPMPGQTEPPTAKPCVARDIVVEPLTDQETYAAGQIPQLSIRLTNNGAADCTLNVGTSGQAFTIMSGSDVWWRSTDCQTEPSDMVVLLAAGQVVTSAAPLAWDRTRSSVSTCDDPNRQTAPGGGASYHLSVQLGGIPSTQSTQILLY